MANCFSAACRKGAPTSKFRPSGAPAYNATCYCPYVTTRQPFLMSSSEYPCGLANASMVKPSTLIYNGGCTRPRSLDPGGCLSLGVAHPLLPRMPCGRQHINQPCLRACPC